MMHDDWDDEESKALLKMMLGVKVEAYRVRAVIVDIEVRESLCFVEMTKCKDSESKYWQGKLEAYTYILYKLKELLE